MGLIFGSDELPEMADVMRPKSATSKLTFLSQAQDYAIFGLSNNSKGPKCDFSLEGRAIL